MNFRYIFSAMCRFSIALFVALNLFIPSKVAYGDESSRSLLSKATVRICCSNPGQQGVSCGTAFFLELCIEKTKGTSVPVLVTNKHVVKGYQKAEFILSERCERGEKPKQHNVPIDNRQWFMHPDDNVDLCAMPVAPILRYAQKIKLNLDIAPIPVSFVATQKVLKNFRQLDDVVMIGYPDSIIDDINNQPIFRKGVFATDPYIDYKGHKQFLVDIATYPGSSGSPVVVIQEGVWQDHETGCTQLFTGRARCYLIGVLFASHMHDVGGRMVQRPIPTSTSEMISWVPNNLGIVIKAEQLLAFEKMFQ